jgi:uncharacterized phage-associated protein
LRVRGIGASACTLQSVVAQLRHCPDFHGSGINTRWRYNGAAQATLRDKPLNIMPYPASAIANEFLRVAKEQAQPITPLHIQKYVYFSHGWFLALKNDPLIKERVCAWDYGPVIPSLYHSFKSFGSGPITSFATETEIKNDGGNLRFVTKEAWVENYSVNEENKVYTLAFIERIWEVYRGFSAVQLSQLTHADDSPWSQARRQKQTVIPDELIRDYFKRQAQAEG